MVNGNLSQLVMDGGLRGSVGKVMQQCFLSATIGNKYYITSVLIKIQLEFVLIPILSRSSSIFAC